MVLNTSCKLLPMVCKQKLAPGLDLQKVVRARFGMGFAVRAPVSLPDKGTLTQIAKIEGSSLLALALGQED